MPPASAGLAYLDLDLAVHATPAASARRMLKPMVLARMIHAADLGPDDSVLDVGGLTGYSSAGDGASGGLWWSPLEEDAELSRHAHANCRDLGLANVTAGDRTADGRMAAGRAL